jgi:cytochrome P450
MSAQPSSASVILGSGVSPPAARLKPHTIEPPARAPGKLGFVARFVRNPLLVVPQPVYEEDFVAYSGGTRPLVWITEPSYIKTVLLDERDAYQKLAQIRLLSPLLGKGILTSEGADWKWQRQTSAPMFRNQEVMSFVPQFIRATDDMLARWRQAGSQSTLSIEHEMTRVTFDVISATLLPSADQTVGVAVERSTAQFQQAGSWAQLYAITNMPRWLPRPGRNRMNAATRQLRDSVTAMIKEHRARDTVRDDLMGRLMISRDPESGQLMNDEQLVDNLLTFYLAGHETTAKALTWTLYILSQSPEWTQALVDEIERVTGGQPISSWHIDKLALTGQVVKESMRVYPPVSMLTRQAVKDARLGSHEIKAGTSVVVPIYAIHRHRKRWQNPEVFDPTRFAPENESAISRYQYLPFGAGPRICIGMAFALVEATAILARILQHARFETPPGYVPTPIGRVTLTPKGGMPLKVTML